MAWGTFSWPEFVNLLPVYIATIISAVLLFLTNKQIRSARDDAARRAAFDFSFNVFRSERHIKCRREFLKIQQSHKDPALLFSNPTKNSHEIDTLTEYLDFQEMFSVGVLNNGISEKFVKEAFELVIKQDWSYLKNFINICLLYTSPSPRDRG